MNQILSVEIEKKKKKNKVSTRSILIIFSIFLIIFGVGMTTTGAYAYYKNLTNKANNNLLINNSTKPSITMEIQSIKTPNIVVSHDKEIKLITYTINGQDTHEIEGNNRFEVKQTITLNAGKNNIKITAKDINGITSEYETTLEVADGPSITLTPIEGKIQAVTESTSNIDKIIYYWDDDKANETVLTINDIKNETLIDVSLEGTHTLHIKAIDKDGVETEKSQTIIGVNKPKIEVTTDGQKFYIKAQDTQGLSKVEITLNTHETITENIEGNEYIKGIDLENGENRLTVKVFNKNNVSQISRVKFTKE